MADGRTIYGDYPGDSDDGIDAHQCVGRCNHPCSACPPGVHRGSGDGACHAGNTSWGERMGDCPDPATTTYYRPAESDGRAAAVLPVCGPCAEALAFLDAYEAAFEDADEDCATHGGE